jgi:glycerol-3-phosphate acyltransferase PlsX
MGNTEKCKKYSVKPKPYTRRIIRIVNKQEQVDKDKKGNQTIQKAHYLLHMHPDIRYEGFIEPHDIFDRPCDIVVCDGFSGNLVVKSVEGTAELFLDALKNIGKKNWFTGLLMWPLKGYIRQSLDRMHPDNNNGAIILGLTHTIIKSHGSCTEKGFVHALRKACLMAEHNLADHIHHVFSQENSTIEETSDVI